MILHDYAIIGHKRSEIGRLLGAASLLLAPILTGLIGLFAQVPFLTESMRDKLVVFTVSTGIVYAALYWLFNRFGWRWLDKILQIPNLNGIWAVSGKTLELNGDVRYEWVAELSITQQWDRIAIELRTSQSRSYSETASILVKHDKEAKLSYSYQNHPKAGEPELQKHQGFCELIFDSDYKTASGHYFNSSGRYTFGSMTLRRLVKRN